MNKGGFWMGTPIAASDLTWLLMDRRNNLMHVHGLLTLESTPDWEFVRSAVFDRAVSKYRVMSQVAVKHGRRRWTWEDDVDFSLDRHVFRVELPDGRHETLQRYISGQFSVRFDRSHPLWDMQLIVNPDNDRAVFLTRFHHGLGDGIRLVQLLLGICEGADDAATPTAVGLNKDGGAHGPLDAVLHVAEHTVKDGLDVLAHSGEVARDVSKGMLSALDPLALPRHMETAFELVRHPVKLLDVLTSYSSDDNEVTNSWREIGRLLLSEKADAEAWSGHPQEAKSVAWSAGIDLAAVKTIAAAYEGTVNDVLMASVSLALTDYLRERGVHDVHDLAWMMPVSLQPIDGSLPDTLGNHFAVVLFSMPLGVSDPAELIAEVHHRTTRLKHSAEPIVAFGVQKVIAEAPKKVARGITDFFSSKTIGQLSNVPGPRTQLRFAGIPVSSVCAFVPTSGDQPLGICVFSYNGSVAVGVSGDSRMVPDPDHISEGVGRHVDALFAAATAHVSHTTSSTSHQGA